jgi:hypothetical protein
MFQGASRELGKLSKVFVKGCTQKVGRSWGTIKDWLEQRTVRVKTNPRIECNFKEK